jgi:hypothetical protein
MPAIEIFLTEENPLPKVFLFVLGVISIFLRALILTPTKFLELLPFGLSTLSMNSLTTNF